MAKREAYRKLHKYYRLLKELHPEIPAKVRFEYKDNLGAIADVCVYIKHGERRTHMRFDSECNTSFKFTVREFLHEMVHVVYPGLKHGERFESKILSLRRELFHPAMAIF